jgi:hypothetical protein
VDNFAGHFPAADSALFVPILLLGHLLPLQCHLLLLLLLSNGRMFHT